jgi:DNA-directed RNA polymerase subunit beta
VLNPLGVPSRMNVGQILEVHLGLGGQGAGLQDSCDAASPRPLPRKFVVSSIRSTTPVASRRIWTNSPMSKYRDGRNLTNGVPFATPVFDGAKEEEIKDMLALAGMPSRPDDVVRWPYR